MPNYKKPEKKPEDDFIPLKPQDIKQSVEVPVKNIPKEQIEKIEKIGDKEKMKKPRKAKKQEERIGEYALIITEKPQAALKIASALSNGKARKYSESGVPYYELERENKKIIVACAAGHLFTLAQEKTGNKKEWPAFNLKWEPNYKTKKNDWSKKYYSLLSKLCKNASEFIVSTDYDVEGEVIGWNIIRFIA